MDGEAGFLHANVTDPAAMDALVAACLARYGRMDAAFNNAGVLPPQRPIHEVTPEEMNLAIDVDFKGVFFAMQSEIRHFLKVGGGAIVNVSSVHAVATSAGVAAYAASKGGLLALTRAMAIEFAPDNVRANAILPGAVDTPMLRASLGRAHMSGNSIQLRLENLARKTVSGKVGTPAEIARAIYFLADAAQSSFMTGQALVVDGGATCRLSTE